MAKRDPRYLKLINRSSTLGNKMAEVVFSRFAPGDKLYQFLVPRKFELGFWRMHVILLELYAKGIYTVNDFFANESTAFQTTFAENRASYDQWFKPFGTVIEVATKHPAHIGPPFVYLIEEKDTGSRHWYVEGECTSLCTEDSLPNHYEALKKMQKDMRVYIDWDNHPQNPANKNKISE